MKHKITFFILDELTALKVRAKKSTETFQIKQNGITTNIVDNIIDQN